MRNRWDDQEAAAFKAKYKSVGDDLALRTYSARLIGSESALVLHGGGNTSVKTTLQTVSGRSVDVLCVKGSGWDLGSIEPQGHPAVKMDSLLALRSLKKLSDEDMVNELRANMLDSSGPNPSVEALLHAFIPRKFIDHTHADSVLALLDQPDAKSRVKEWAGKKLAFVPYIMPGFALAQLAAKIYEQSPDVEGLLLYKHGIFTFGESAKESYDRMIKWVSLAETVLSGSKIRPLSRAMPHTLDKKAVQLTANLLRKHIVLPRTASPFIDDKRRMIVRFRSNPPILDFLSRRDLARVSQQGPATPDHVIRTKGTPILLAGSYVEKRLDADIKGKVAAFVRRYEAYFKKESGLKRVKRKQLDPFPRLVLAPGLGLFSVAADAKAAEVALDIYEHTIWIIEQATRYGRYETLPPGDLFDMEYWSLEQAKLGKEKVLPLGGQVAWISGAASGIGLATAKLFAQLGAHVFATDVDGKRLDGVLAEIGKAQVTGGSCDVTKIADVEASLSQCSQTFGGVDIVISNAGIAPSAPMTELTEDLLRRSFEINFFAHQNVAKAAAKVLIRQNLGGALLFNASKSAFNPGPDFGPYTLPKTAVIGLMKQYAVELGRYGIRANAVNADRVNTNLFGEGLLQKRAKARGVSVNAYLSGNLLGQEVLAEDVAAAFLHLVQAKKTTGATLPVDGGNAAAFPR